MRDDDLMDALLRDAMRAEAPALSDGFDARLLQLARTRGLSPAGRAVIIVYAIAAAAVAIALMRDLPAATIAAGIASSVLAATAASAYLRQLAPGPART